VLQINADGMVAGSARIVSKRFLSLERGPMNVVRGIIVHQTDAATAQATFNKYKGSRPAGAHFLVDKDGAIYQTASLKKRTVHVGALKARCLAEMTCEPAQFAGRGALAVNAVEMKKAVPARYPSNSDSVGIELVGRCYLPPGFKIPSGASALDIDKLRGEYGVYELATGAQNASLRWLTEELRASLHVPESEIHRHPDVSWKNLTEASSASWR
jgi:N-acetyl-anhydromuramyl-L-alanine amidase AmpD